MKNLLTLFVDSAPFGLAIFDRAQRYLYVNSVVANLNGLPALEHLGKSPREVVPDLADSIGAYLDRALAGEYCLDQELQGEAPGIPGHQQSWLTSYYPIFDHRGEVLAVGVTIFDVTDQRRIQSALVLSEQQYQSVVSAMQEGVVIHQADGTIVACNRSAERILQLPASHIIGRDSHDERWQAIREDGSPFHGGDHPAMITLQTGNAQTDVVMGLVRPGNEVSWISINSQPLLSSDRSTTLGAVVTFSDITGRKQIEDALHRREAILRAVGVIGERLLLAPDWEHGIDNELEQLGIAAGVSRVYIFQNSVDVNGVIRTSQRHEWVASGVRSQADNPDLQNIPLIDSGFERWVHELSLGRPIKGDISEFPPLERELLAAQEIQSIAVVPIFDGDGWWGFIGFDECSAKRNWSPAEIDALRVAANILGAAIQRKRIEEERSHLVREQAARAEIEAANRRFAFLAQASNLLADSLDFEATLVTVARLAVPDFAERCAVHIIDEDGGLRRLELAHSNPGEAENARRLLEQHQLDWFTLHGPSVAARTGRTQYFPVITDRDLEGVPSRLNQQQHPSGEVTSAIIVPLIARGRTLGAISFLRSDPNRRFTNADLSMAEDLALRCGMAIDNARLYREAQEASRQKDDFLATISHELRTPLTAILGYTDILLQQFHGSLNERQVHYQQSVRANTQRLLALVNDLLDISRIELSGLELQIAPLEVAAELDRAISHILPLATEKGLSIELKFEDNLPAIAADTEKLQQVLSNLLSNSIKFTPAGGRIIVEAERQGATVRISVVDTGTGIAPDRIERIWDRFYQVDSSKTRQFGGTGLGLSIVRGLVHLMGGSVSASSAGVGQGATFSFTMPQAEPSQPIP